MKVNRNLLIILISLTWISVKAQENSVTLSGGYSFTNIEDFEEGTSGWRVNVLYEFTPFGGNVSHGFSFGYVQTMATVTETGSESEFKAERIPIYYAPKYSFGQEGSFRPFLKGAVGWQFANYDKTLPNIGGNIKTGSSGFYGGLGVGISKAIGDVLLINLEYEWAYMDNTWYVDGFLNTAMLGFGIRV